MRKRTVPFLMLVATGLILANGSGAHAAVPIFQIQPSPNGSVASISDNILNATTSIAPNDAWAVGSFMGPTSPTTNTLVTHYNGTTWSIVPSPNGTSGSELDGVAAVSSTNVWAVGFQHASPDQPVTAHTTLIEHWDGTRWSIVPSPNAGTNGNVLTHATVSSANDVWAAGSALGQPLFEHWNGSRWSIVPVPNVPHETNLIQGISAASSKDVWAVGNSVDSSDGSSSEEILHWNGTAWAVLPTIPLGTTSALLSVRTVSATDVWAVGTKNGLDGGDTANLALHWDGRQWREVPVPNVGTRRNGLTGVTVLSSRDVWAAGFADDDAGTPHTLIEHWNGTAWSVVPAPNQIPQGDNPNSLNGISASAPGQVIAVGSYNSFEKGNPGSRTLIVGTTQG